MSHEIKKELRFGLRSGRFVILAAAFAFYAMLTPVLMKMVLPSLIKSQMPGLTQDVLDQMFHMSQIGCIQSYMGDVLEIGSILIAFSLCGLIAQEIRENTLVLPLCSGKRLSHILAAKLTVFGAALILIPMAALALNYLYAGMMYSFDISLSPILLGGLLQGLFMVFMLSCLLFFGAVIQKPMAAGFVTLGIVYVSGAVGSLLKITSWLPAGLLDEAQKLNETPSPDVMKPVLMTLAFIAAFYAGTLLNLRHMEWNRR